MPKRTSLIIGLAIIATGLSVSTGIAAQVNVGINVGVPAPPPIVLAAPPPVVVVPSGNAEPDGGLQVTAGLGSQSSTAVTV